MGERQHSLPSPSISLCPTPSPALFSDSLYLFIFFYMLCSYTAFLQRSVQSIHPLPKPPTDPTVQKTSGLQMCVFRGPDDPSRRLHSVLQPTSL